ncbi:MAG: endonuclease III [Chloroflexi bacterium]|nr:endonuclease III [Chloroflexota bacterium]
MSLTAEDRLRSEKLAQVHTRLMAAFGKPDWHELMLAVDELVCTILSQNTNDINRDKAFRALKERYPTWEEVRDADPAELQYVIRIAGLALQKGPNIQAALKAITAEQGTISLEWLKELNVEEARDWLTQLKGVGPKTAAIVMVFSLGMPAFPVDTHVFRVTGRIGLRPAKMNVEKTHAYLEMIGDPAVFGPLHLNLITLGREYCLARKPKCSGCPVVDLCDYPDKNFET